MATSNPFTLPGSWYKGALHAHTTRSDGKLSPAESAAAHKAHGYHFLAITDHDVITDMSAFSDASFLTIPGVELSHGRNEVGQSYHMVLVGIRQVVRAAYNVPIQEAIDTWAEAAQLLFIPHAYWSGMELHELLPLERLAGMEIWNTSANTDLGKGLSTVHWDSLLARNKAWAGFATDDTHGINDDFDGGWVCVKSERLDEASILTALNSGAFYSSSGPTIHDFRIENGVAYIRCSAATTINFIGIHQWGWQYRAEPGHPLTEAEYKLKGKERYLRAECRDAHGNTAWTNPLFLP
jgi:hypothetical protein